MYFVLYVSKLQHFLWIEQEQAITGRFEVGGIEVQLDCGLLICREAEYSVFPCQRIPHKGI